MFPTKLHYYTVKYLLKMSCEKAQRKTSLHVAKPPMHAISRSPLGIVSQ